MLSLNHDGEKSVLFSVKSSISLYLALYFQLRLKRAGFGLIWNENSVQRTINVIDDNHHQKYMKINFLYEHRYTCKCLHLCSPPWGRWPFVLWLQPAIQP